MIGAAGARRFAAGDRAGLDLDARPSLPLAGTDDAGGERAAGRARSGRRSGPRSAAAGLRARHALSQNFLADVDVLEGILAEAAPEPGRRVLEIGPGLGLLTGALLEAGAAVTAVELDRGLAAFLRERFEGPLEAGHARAWSRATRSTRTSSGSSAAVRRRRQPAVPHHQPDPARAARRAAAAGAARAHGPARGRRADRGAAREDELPLGVRPVPRAGPDRVHACRPDAFEPAPAVESAVIVVEPYRRRRPARPGRRGRAVAAGPGRASASAARCSTTSWPRQLPVDAGRGRPRPSPTAGIDARPAPADARGGGVAGPARGARADRCRLAAAARRAARVTADRRTRRGASRRSSGSRRPSST